MNNIEKVKEVIKNNIEDALFGIFDCPIACDPMETIYDNNGIRIEICYRYGYFEVFGLTDKEFADIEEFYMRCILKSFEKDKIALNGGKNND